MGKTKRLVKLKPPGAVYIDSINYAEVAATIIEHVHEALGDEDLLGQALIGGEVNIEDFAGTLEGMFDTVALHELITTQFGRGILFGMYLRIKEESLVNDEQEVLDEMDV